MSRVLRKAIVALALALVPLSVPAPRAADPTVEEIHVQGLVRMTRDAVLHVLGVKVGDPYDPAKIRSQFRKMWGLGVFSDISIEAEDGPQGGKVLIVKIKERPVLTSLSYEENKVLTRTQIEDRLKEKKIRFDVGKPLSLKGLFEAESAIRDYLGEKGYLDAQVSHRLDRPTESTAAVYFSIRPGGKTRIRSIRFVGNQAFSSRKLQDQLKLTQAWRWWWPWSAKNLYHPAKWEMDVGSIRDLYENHGYLDVDIRPPVVDVREIVKEGKKKPAEEAAPPAAQAAPPPSEEEGLSPKEIARRREKERAREEKARKKAEKERQKAEPKIKRWVELAVQIAEGPQYRAGDLTVTGNTVFTDERIRAMVPIRKGDVVNIGILKMASDAITRMYGDRGYYLATVVHQRQRDSETKVADLQISINEDKPYYVARIEFAGNTFTQDKVLRREVPVQEGELFSRSRLDLGVSKINQLGYFQAKDQPIVEPLPGENRVRITVEGEEQSRNEIQVGGGYSGLDGAFFTGYFSTRNFLGRGQVASLSAQVGGRATRYSVSFLEPWFLGRPNNLGFSLFRRDYNYGSSLESSSDGLGVVIGRRFGYYTNIRLSYNFERVKSTGFSVSGGVAENRIASLTPTYGYFRINNPYRPTRGWSLDLLAQFAGGPIGGDSDFWKPVAQYSGYRRGPFRTYFGLHAEAGQIRAWGSNENPTTAEVNGIPRFSRFWIGGDSQGPRVFETRTVTPLRFVRLDYAGRIVEIIRDPTGVPADDFDRNGDGILDRNDLVEVGGDRYFLAQGEWVAPLGDTVEAAFFLDVGNSLFEDTPWGFDDVRASAGLEMRFYLPVFPVPLRLIYGWPLRKINEDRTSNFMFSIGRSF